MGWDALKAFSSTEQLNGALHLAFPCKVDFFYDSRVKDESQKRYPGEPETMSRVFLASKVTKWLMVMFSLSTHSQTYRTKFTLLTVVISKNCRLPFKAQAYILTALACV